MGGEPAHFFGRSIYDTALLGVNTCGTPRLATDGKRGPRPCNKPIESVDFRIGHEDGGMGRPYAESHGRPADIWWWTCSGAF